MRCSNSTGMFLLFLMNIFHDEILAKSNLYSDQQRMANDHSPNYKGRVDELLLE